MSRLFIGRSFARQFCTSRPANESASVLKTEQKDDAVTTIQPQQDALEVRLDVGALYPDKLEWIDERQVRISRPSKNVMQSGTSYTNVWKIDFDNQPRGENWLMGWTSTADPLSNLSMTFPSKEAAIEFCNKRGLQWFVEEQPERRLRKKSYADNFSWDRRTRTSNK